MTLLLKSSTENKIKFIFWISAGICCQKIHRRGSGGWKEMWSRCFAHSMQCLTPLLMQWLSCSLILEAEKSHLIVSSSTCFGSLFYLFSEKLGHSNNMIFGFICFCLTFWNLSLVYAGHCCAPLWILPRPAKSSWSCWGGPPSPPWRTPSPWTTPGTQYSWRMLN